MKYPIFLILLVGIVTPVAAQEGAPQGGSTKAVTDPFAPTGGEEIYRGLCQGCHQPDGSGATGAGAYPALAGSDNLEYPDYAISLVLNGYRAMPPFRDLLDDEQIVAVVRFIQTNWGNTAETEASADLLKATHD